MLEGARLALEAYDAAEFEKSHAGKCAALQRTYAAYLVAREKHNAPLP